MIKFLVKKLESWTEKRGRQYVIMDDYKKEVPEPYLVRSILFKSRWFCIYIHRFLKSDKAVPHDHPWWFITWVISGGYIEELYYDIQKDMKSCHIILRRPWTVALRKPTDVHRVIISETFSLKEKNKAPLTICFIGPHRQEWGFFETDKKIGWKEFLNIDPSDPSWEGHE